MASDVMVRFSLVPSSSQASSPNSYWVRVMGSVILLMIVKMFTEKINIIHINTIPIPSNQVNTNLVLNTWPLQMILPHSIIY